MNLWFLCAMPPFLCKMDYISDSRSHILTPVTPKHLLSTPNSASPTRSTERGKFTHSGREQAIIFYVYNMEAQTEKYKYPSLTTDSRPTLVLAGGGWADSLLLCSSSLVRLFWGLLGLYGVMHENGTCYHQDCPTWSLRQAGPRDLTFPTTLPASASTVSPRRNVTPKLAIMGWSPPKNNPFHETSYCSFLPLHPLT